MVCQTRLLDAFRKDNLMEKEVFRKASSERWGFVELAGGGRIAPRRRSRLMLGMGVGCEKEKNSSLSFSGGSLVKNPPANAGDTGSIPDQGRSRVLQLLKPECARARAPQQEKPPQ